MGRQLHRWPLLAALLLATVAVVAVWHIVQPPDRAPVVPGPPAAPTRWSELAPPPAWESLAAYHRTTSRDRFEQALDLVFTMSPAWRQWIRIEGNEARIDTGTGREFHLQLASAPSVPPPRWWRPAAAQPAAAPGRPLAGVRIAIDPGHLGGPWAQLEERWFQVGSAPPVKEGDLTLVVARLLKPRLEQLGAQTTLLRDSTEPLTSWRPESLRQAGLAAPAAGSPEDPRRLAERLFYRTAEIRARARIVNEQIRPDLVLCLHFNAEQWGDPARPALSDRNHFHLLMNGAYTDGEIALADQRCDLLLRLLERTDEEEIALGVTAAAVFAERTKLPPYSYETGSIRARNLGGTPYLWARNLLANRLYRCPVLFYEPYVMNSAEVHARIQAGDYPGQRLVAGAMRPSIFREYADAVAAGLGRHYAQVRQ